MALNFQFWVSRDPFRREDHGLLVYPFIKDHVRIIGVVVSVLGLFQEAKGRI